MTEPAPEPLPDTLVIPYAERLLACLCAELAQSLGGPVCDCCLRPGGALVPMDSCGCGCSSANGQASVQVTSIFPTSKFPRRGVDTEYRGPCGTAVTWAADLTMTVYRCVHGLKQDGAPPTCGEMDLDARIIQADAAAMRRAFACCDWNQPDPALRPAAIIPGAWSPVPPMGNCAGGFMPVTVDLGTLCCPDTDS